MNKTLLIFLCLILGLISKVNSQVIYNHKIDSLINFVSIQQLLKTNKEITGDTLAMINGTPKRIVTRYEGTPGNLLAAQYIFEKFVSYGLSAKYQMIGNNIVNVIGWKAGAKYPNKYFLLGAHYDNFLTAINLDTIYGADDDGTGICVLLEAAKLTQGFNTDYSVAFVAFNFEETSGLGSRLYSDSARIRGDSLMGVLNAEMLGYDGNGDNKITVITNPNSEMLYKQFLSSLTNYKINLTAIESGPGMTADHISFWNNNFKAITTSEYIGELNPNMHLLSDRWFNLNPALFEKLAKANIATLLSWATGNYYEIQHTPSLSNFDTTARVIIAEVIMPYPVNSGSQSPKLYYKINSGSYISKNAFEVIGNKYKFSIPEQTHGTKVSYYIAAQDSLGSIGVTAPFGGGGVNPPGNVPPQYPYVYYVFKTNLFSSPNVPIIIASGTTKDTIHINNTGNVVEIKLNLNITNQNNSDLSVDLMKMKVCTNIFSLGTCSGSNFINTNFSDTANLKINQGSAPYSGFFRIADTLANFKKEELQGDWILIINNSGSPATLNGWSLMASYENTIAVNNESEIIPIDYKLFQNYPNPFNSSTEIIFHVPKTETVRLDVYDILGHKIETLVNEILRPGNYNVLFDCDNLPSGVYFYKLTTEYFTSTKRMLLIK